MKIVPPLLLFGMTLCDPVAQEKHLMIAEGICERALDQVTTQLMQKDVSEWERLEVKVREGVTAQAGVIALRKRRCDRDSQNLEQLKKGAYKLLYRSQRLTGMPDPKAHRKNCLD